MKLSNAIRYQDNSNYEINLIFVDINVIFYLGHSSAETPAWYVGSGVQPLVPLNFISDSKDSGDSYKSND